MQPNLTLEGLEELRKIHGCTLADAIETFRERLRNEGFMNNSVRSFFPQLPNMIGYAVTLKVRGSAPPMADGSMSIRQDWWDYVLSLPSPRVVVIQDIATRIGLGSFLGGVHVNILRALGCCGAVTNGSVRELPIAEQIGFPLFATNVSLSHAYLHVVEFGQPVEVAGLQVQSGDLIHGSRHGVQTIPLKIAGQLPQVAARLAAKDQKIIELCQSDNFTVEKLRSAVSNP